MIETVKKYRRDCGDKMAGHFNDRYLSVVRTPGVM
jgi:hypothetical protein